MKFPNKSTRCAISALHAGQPIPGLRSSGKGANRTILDCLFRPIGREKRSFCRRGGRGRRQPPLVRLCVAWGGSTGCSLERGVIVTAAAAAGHPTLRDFRFVATGCATRVGEAATIVPFGS